MIKNFKEFKKLVDTQITIKETPTKNLFTPKLYEAPYEIIYRYVANEVSKDILTSMNNLILKSNFDESIKSSILLSLNQKCANYIDLGDYNNYKVKEVE